HNESSMAEVPHVALVRSFGRIVRDPDMVQRIAQQNFAKRADPACLARATGARASADPDSILDAQTAALLTQHRAVLSAPQIRPVKAPPIAKIGVLGAFAMMLRFIFTGLKQLPGQARIVFSDAVLRAVGEFAQSVV